MLKKLSVLLFFTILSSEVSADLLRTTDLKKYCSQEGVKRQTILYLDQGIIAKKDPNWYKDILNKTKFFPGERLQVVTIKTGGTKIEQAWDTCYPTYTANIYDALKSKEGFGSMFTGGVDENLANDLKSFNKSFTQALAHPLRDTKHDMPPSYSKGNFPGKKLVEALYYDAKRLDLENGISRVIIFSDMIEQSDLIEHSNFDPSTAVDKIAKRFPLFLNHASFYIYGVNYTNEDTSLNQKMESFWNAFLLKSGAVVEHYGTQLVLPKNNQLFSAHSYQGKLTQSDGKKLASKLRLAFFDNGELTHSWLTIGDHYLALKGSLNCSGQNCMVNAVVSASTFDGFEKNDILKLKGSINNMTGKIGARDDSVIDEQGKIYSFSVEYSQDKILSL